MSKFNKTVGEEQLSLVVYANPPELPVQERPHARILRDGATACSTAELLQVLIGGPDAETAARQLLDQCRDLRGVAQKSIYELAQLVHGLGEGKASRLKASLELGKRLFAAANEQRLQIRTPADAANLLMPTLSLLEQEEVHVLMLDSRNRLIGSPVMIYKGQINSASMRVCEVFREAIRHNAKSIVVAHNHPSGDPSPSSDDVFVTKELCKAGKLLDIDVLDHVVIGVIGSGWVSLKERGLGFE